MRALAAVLLIAALAPSPLIAEEQRPAHRPEEVAPDGAEQAPAVTESVRPEPAPQVPAEPEKVDPAVDTPEETGPAQAKPAARSKPEREAGTEPEPDFIGPAAPPIHATLREDDFSYSACLLELTLLGSDYEERAPVSDEANRDCGIDRPIMLQSPLPGVAIEGGALMRCDTARHLAHWLRDFVRPASALLPGQPRLVGLVAGSTYQCRATVGNGGGKTSEHAFGNAFDIAAFRFDDGSTIEVAPRKDDGDLLESFQHAVRATACLHFATVLGPGSNAAHDNHLHLDIKARKGGYRLCQ